MADPNQHVEEKIAPVIFNLNVDNDDKLILPVNSELSQLPESIDESDKQLLTDLNDREVSSEDLERMQDDDFVSTGKLKLEITDEKNRSIYVKNIDLSVTPNDLENLFKQFGIINIVSLLCDRYSGTLKGYGYVEFATVKAKEDAKSLNGTEFRGRKLKIEDLGKTNPNYYGHKRPDSKYNTLFKQTF